jgi:hypothetical protein
MNMTLNSYLYIVPILFYLHPIHVSITEIEFDRKDKALEIMMRVFIDDLELTLRNSLNKPELDILNPQYGSTTDQLVEKYLADHFRITLDNKIQKTRYLGHEREGEAFIFYIEVPNVSDWKTIGIHNDIIMATYDDQSNIVHVYVDDNVKSLRLTPRAPSGNLTFD